MVQTKHNTTCWIIAIVILILHTVLGTTSFLQKSATYDEPGHIAGGYISLKYSDFRSNPEGGQLAQRLAAIPLLMLNIDNPIEPPVEQLGKKKYSEKTYYEGLNILYENNTHRPYALLLSRLVILFLSAFWGMALYLLSRKIWGPLGAVITVAVYGFSPTILAHARLVTPDLFVAVFFTFAVFAVWHVLHKISISGILLAGTTVGCLVLSKFSGLLIGPMAVMLIGAKVAIGRPLIIGLPYKWCVIRSRWKQLPFHLLSATISLLIALAIIWAAYDFRFSAKPIDTTNTETAPMQYAVDFPLITFLNNNNLLPESFLYGLSYTLDSTQRRPAFMNGKYSMTGWPIFFPYAILIKTAAPILTLFLLIPLCIGFAKKRRRLLHAVIPLIILSATYLFFLINSDINIGHRHALPLYPALAILAGALVIPLEINISFLRRGWMVMSIAMGVWLMSESFWCWPNYLSYFNSLVGGPSKGYRLLVDSSLDWGQDLGRLVHWLQTDSQPPGGPNYLLYFGTSPPKYEKLHNTINLKPQKNFSSTIPLLPGRYCISATELQRVYEPMSGPWTAEKEAAYKRQMLLVKQFFPKQDVSGISDSQVKKNDKALLAEFEKLRLGRLLAYLRQREPDKMIGYSILIYELTAKDIYEAIWGPSKSFVGLGA